MAQSVAWVSPVGDDPNVLVVRDDDHNNDFPNDTAYVAQALADVGYRVTYVQEEDGASGLRSEEMQGYDVAWFSNPGQPIDDTNTARPGQRADGPGQVLRADEPVPGPRACGRCLRPLRAYPLNAVAADLNTPWR
jgi:hypothetical protein